MPGQDPDVRTAIRLGWGTQPHIPEVASETQQVCSAPCKSTDLLWKVCEGFINAVYHQYITKKHFLLPAWETPQLSGISRLPQMLELH